MLGAVLRSEINRVRDCLAPDARQTYGLQIPLHAGDVAIANRTRQGLGTMVSRKSAGQERAARHEIALEGARQGVILFERN